MPTQKPRIKPLDLGMFYDDGDSVESNIREIEEKINEIIRFLDESQEEEK